MEIISVAVNIIAVYLNTYVPFMQPNPGNGREGKEYNDSDKDSAVHGDDNTGGSDVGWGAGNAGSK